MTVFSQASPVSEDPESMNITFQGVCSWIPALRMQGRKAEPSGPLDHPSSETREDRHALAQIIEILHRHQLATERGPARRAEDHVRIPARHGKVRTVEIVGAKA